MQTAGKHWKLHNNGCALLTWFVANYTAMHSLGKGIGGRDFCFSLVPNVFSWGSQRVHWVLKLFQKLESKFFSIFWLWSKEVLLFGGAHMALPQKTRKKNENFYFISFHVRCRTIENSMQQNSQTTIRWNWTPNKQVINYYGR